MVPQEESRMGTDILHISEIIQSAVSFELPDIEIFSRKDLKMKVWNPISVFLGSAKRSHFLPLRKKWFLGHRINIEMTE